jgi:hypothetical protein
LLNIATCLLFGYRYSVNMDNSSRFLAILTFLVIVGAIAAYLNEPPRNPNSVVPTASGPPVACLDCFPDEPFDKHQAVLTIQEITQTEHTTLLKIVRSYGYDYDFVEVHAETDVWVEGENELISPTELQIGMVIDVVGRGGEIGVSIFKADYIIILDPDTAMIPPTRVPPEAYPSPTSARVYPPPIPKSIISPTMPPNEITEP